MSATINTCIVTGLTDSDELSLKCDETNLWSSKAADEVIVLRGAKANCTESKDT